MDFRKKQYWKDLLKWYCYSFLGCHAGKLQTPMRQVILQLQIRNLLPERIDALEMFGMHGLWHTMDYVRYVDALDFFEIDSVYLGLAKRKLSKYNVKFHCEDSIAYIGRTEKMYSLIVSDSPFGGNFYDKDGLPYFLKDMVVHVARHGVLIFNFANQDMPKLHYIERKINEIRKTEEVFMVVRHEQMSYIVVAFKESEAEH